MGWFSRLRPEPGITIVVHTEAMAAIDEERAVAPYACGPLQPERIRLWMPDTDLHQDELSQVVDFMVTRGRLTLPGVLLREPDAARPNQVAIAAGGIRLGRLPDEVAAAVAGPVMDLKAKGWLAVGSVSFVVSQPDAAGGSAAEGSSASGANSAGGPDSAGGAGGANSAGGSSRPADSVRPVESDPSTPGVPRGRIGCRLTLPDLADLATTLAPR